MMGLENRNAEYRRFRLGTRASANTSGPDPTRAKQCRDEIAELKRSAPNEEKLVSSARPASKGTSHLKFDPAV